MLPILELCPFAKTTTGLGVFALGLGCFTFPTIQVEPRSSAKFALTSLGEVLRLASTSAWSISASHIFRNHALPWISTVEPLQSSGRGNRIFRGVGRRHNRVMELDEFMKDIFVADAQGGRCRIEAAHGQKSGRVILDIGIALASAR